MLCYFKMAENSFNNVNSHEKELNENLDQNSRPSSVNRGSIDREERLRQVRERQNEERLRKLNEIKQQALQAQRVREQKEEERRKRIEEMRTRDNDRRAQVEERKRQIEDVERDRREYIIRKNQEREARLESKRRNERGSSVFAFGSSTPRMLEPADTGGSSFWTNRRATSTTNMMFAGLPFSRRSSERDFDGSKKRATSAGGLDREPSEDDTDNVGNGKMVQSGGSSNGGNGNSNGNNQSMATMYSNRVARRRTDLMPTIPSPRDTSLTQLQHTKSFTRSPGRAYSMTRLDQLAQPRLGRTQQFQLIYNQQQQQQQQQLSSQLDVVVEHRVIDPTRSYQKKILLANNNNHLSKDSRNKNSLSRSMSHLAGSRPLQKSTTSTSMSHLNIMRPSGHCVTPPRMNKTERMRRQRLSNANSDSNSHSMIVSPPSGVRSGEATPSRPGSAMSGASSTVSGVIMRRPTSAMHTPPRRPRPASIAGTGLTSDYIKKNSTSNSDVKNAGILDQSKPPIPHPRKSTSVKSVERNGSAMSKSALGLKTSSARSSAKTTPLQSPTTEHMTLVCSGDIGSSKSTPKRKISRNETLMNGSSNSNNGRKMDKTSVNKMVESSTKEMVETLTEIVQAQTIESKQNLDEINKVVIELNNGANSNNKLINLDDDSVKTVENGKLNEIEVVVDDDKKKNINEISTSEISQQPNIDQTESTVDVMSASMIAKIRITTEEEAKAALAERRRLAREELERQAELERQRLENEARLQAERERAEEEEQRRLEEETLRLAQEQREAEEQRLLQAIEEAQRKEAEERMRRIEEEKQKAEKEEVDRKAREEAEKQRIELAAKLEKEEKEREARRKRVEAIMLRTRGRGGSGGSSSGGNAASTTINSSGVTETSNDSSNNLDNSSSNNMVLNEGENEENSMLIRNGTSSVGSVSDSTTTTKYNNSNDNNSSILREVQLSQTTDTIYNNQSRQSIDNQLISDSPMTIVNEQQTATNKVPLNGSNVVHIFDQRLATSNANPGSVDVLDTINSNKSETQPVLTTDLV